MSKTEETQVEEVKEAAVVESKEKPTIFKTFGLVSMIIGIVGFFIGAIIGLDLDSLRRLAIFALIPLLLMIVALVGIAFGIMGLISGKAKVQSIVGVALSSVDLFIEFMVILSLT